jgi:RNA polymerase sigma-70 factor, ECF subfamily
MSRESHSDADLMAATRSGDPDAFAVLVERHKDPLVGYLGRLTGCRERAADLAQETFLRLFQHCDRYREQGQLKALLYRIATNLLRSEQRRERRFRLLQPLLGATSDALRPDPEATIHRRALGGEQRGHVARALAALPLRYRVPLVLYELEEWTYGDIAAHLGCREGTIKSRIHRGRQRLREHLAPYWREVTEPTVQHKGEWA